MAEHQGRRGLSTPPRVDQRRGAQVCPAANVSRPHPIHWGPFKNPTELVCTITDTGTHGTYMHSLVHTHMSYPYAQRSPFPHTHAHMHIHTQTCTHMHVLMHMSYPYARRSTFPHRHAHMHIHTWTYTHMHVQALTQVHSTHAYTCSHTWHTQVNAYTRTPTHGVAPLPHSHGPAVCRVDETAGEGAPHEAVAH